MQRRTVDVLVRKKVTLVKPGTAAADPAAGAGGARALPDDPQDEQRDEGDQQEYDRDGCGIDRLVDLDLLLDVLRHDLGLVRDVAADEHHRPVFADGAGEGVGGLHREAGAVERGVEGGVALGHRARRGVADGLAEAVILEEAAGVGLGHCCPSFMSGE